MKKLLQDNVYKMDVFDFLKSVEDNSIDLAVVDPPYNMKKGEWDNFKTDAQYFNFTFKWLDILLTKLKPTGSFYLFNNPYNSAIILNYLSDKQVCYKNWITWYKKDGFSATRKRYVNNQETILYYTMNDKDFVFNSEDIRMPYLSTDRILAAQTKGILKNGKRWFPNANGKLCPDVWEITSQRHVDKIKGRITKQKHPTPKPVEMIERIIKASSNKGDMVLDLFSGTGTTSYVAKMLQRHFLACEKDTGYVEIIKERLKSWD